MATSKARALFLIISATSALFLSSGVDDDCVSCKPHSLESVAHTKLPQTPASFKGPPSNPLVSPLASKPIATVDPTAVDLMVVDRTVVVICHQTDYPDICISSVGAHLKGTANQLSVLAAEIEACSEKAKSAVTEVTKLATDPSKSPSYKMALSTCKELYEYVINSLSNAQKAVAAHDVGTLNSQLSAVITYASTCDDSFVEFNLKSPLEGADRILQKLGSNCLAIAAQTHL